MTETMTEPQARPLTEESRRLPTWREGIPITLADNEEWQIPRVAASFAPSEEGDGYALVFPEDVAALVEAVDDAEEGGAIIKAELALAAHLLRQNYDLTPAELGKLIRFGYGEHADPRHAAMRDAFLAAGTGREPRPKAQFDMSS